MVKRQFTEAQEAVIRDRYLAGETQDQIAADYGCPPHRITRALRRLGVAIEPHQKRRFSNTEVEQIVARYEAGESIMTIATSLHAGTGFITRLLREQGVTIRPSYVNKFAPAVEAEIAERYRAGETAEALHSQYGVGAGTIRRIAKAAGVPIRPWGGQRREYSPEEVAEMGRRWEAGESQSAIAQTFNCSQVVISRLLQEAGYTPESRLRRGEHSNFWKGGRTVNQSGYWQVLIPPDHKFASMRNRIGYVLEHRLVMAEQLGRPLLRTETVHHKDGNRLNNEPDNLQLRQGRHGHGTVYCCADCGSRNIIPCAIDD